MWAGIGWVFTRSAPVLSDASAPAAAVEHALRDELRSVAGLPDWLRAAPATDGEEAMDIPRRTKAALTFLESQPGRGRSRVAAGAATPTNLSRACICLTRERSRRRLVLSARYGCAPRLPRICDRRSSCNLSVNSARKWSSTAGNRELLVDRLSYASLDLAPGSLRGTPGRPRRSMVPPRCRSPRRDRCRAMGRHSSFLALVAAAAASGANCAAPRRRPRLPVDRAARRLCTPHRALPPGGRRSVAA